MKKKERQGSQVHFKKMSSTKIKVVDKGVVFF